MRFRHHVRKRSDHYFVWSEFGTRYDDIDPGVTRGERTVPGNYLRKVAQTRMAGLNLHRPGAVVVEDQRGLGDILRFKHILAKSLQFFDGLPDLFKARTWRAVVVQNAVPVFLRPRGCGIPPEVVHSHGSMSDRLVSPKPQLPFFGLRGKCVLACFSRLLFHDHERLSVFQTPPKIVTHRHHREDRFPIAAFRIGLSLHEHLEKTGIVIEGNEIKLRV